MKITIYSEDELKDIYDLMNQTAICREPPDEFCSECKTCFQYTITIEKVADFSETLLQNEVGASTDS